MPLLWCLDNQVCQSTENWVKRWVPTFWCCCETEILWWRGGDRWTVSSISNTGAVPLWWVSSRSRCAWWALGRRSRAWTRGKRRKTSTSRYRRSCARTWKAGWSAWQSSSSPSYAAASPTASECSSLSCRKSFQTWRWLNRVSIHVPFDSSELTENMTSRSFWPKSRFVIFSYFMPL